VLGRCLVPLRLTLAFLVDASARAFGADAPNIIRRPFLRVLRVAQRERPRLRRRTTSFASSRSLRCLSFVARINEPLAALELVVCRSAEPQLVFARHTRCVWALPVACRLTSDAGAGPTGAAPRLSRILAARCGCHAPQTPGTCAPHRLLLCCRLSGDHALHSRRHHLIRATLGRTCELPPHIGVNRELPLVRLYIASRWYTLRRAYTFATVRGP